MLVCLCKGVPDKRVREAIDGGADSLEAIGQACGAGTGCGACHDMLERMLTDGGQSSPLELARAALGGSSGSGGCPDCPRRAAATAVPSTHPKRLGEAA